MATSTALPVTCPRDLALSPWPVGYAPVVSLAVTRWAGSRGHEILVAIRDPAANQNHPDVVSVPTQRLSYEEGQFLLARILGDEAPAADIGVFDPEPPTLENRIVRALMLEKLGLEAESDTQFSATLRRLDCGTSLIGLHHGTDQIETLAMFGLQVLVGQDYSPPSSSRSYSFIGWIPAADFVLLATTRDSTVLPIGLKAAEVCVHGLCMQSALEIVRTYAISPSS